MFLVTLSAISTSLPWMVMTVMLLFDPKTRIEGMAFAIVVYFIWVGGGFFEDTFGRSQAIVASNPVFGWAVVGLIHVISILLPTTLAFVVFTSGLQGEALIVLVLALLSGGPVLIQTILIHIFI